MKSKNFDFRTAYRLQGIFDIIEHQGEADWYVKDLRVLLHVDSYCDYVDITEALPGEILADYRQTALEYWNDYYGPPLAPEKEE